MLLFKYTLLDDRIISISYAKRWHPKTTKPTKKPSSIRMSTVTFWIPIDYSLLSFTLQMSSRSQIYTKHSQERFYFINTLKLCTQCRWSGCLENLPQMTGLYLGKWWRELPSPIRDYTPLSNLILKFQINKRTLKKLFFLFLHKKKFF